MKPYVIKMPKFVSWIYPKRIWAFDPTEKNVYLTFDDGPIPEVTPWVLDQLKKYNAKATFFCIGNNIRQHPKIFDRILHEGHSVGNHTFDHINGWKSSTTDYLENVKKVDQTIQTSKETTISSLFRPPFGKLTSPQAKMLQDEGYKIVMWNVLSADFDPSIDEEQCLSNVLYNINPGSIIVFHDSIKANEKLRYVLPKVLDFISDNGWKLKEIRMD